MKVKIVMLEADPRDLRVSGEVRERGKQSALHSGVSSRIGFAEEFGLGKGAYTYVFAISRKGTFQLVAVNATNGAEIGPVKRYEVKSTKVPVRYFFEVP